VWVGGIQPFAQEKWDRAEQGTAEWDWWCGVFTAALHVTKRGARPAIVSKWLTDGHLPPMAHEGYVQTGNVISNVVQSKKPPTESYEAVLGQPKLGPDESRIPSRAATENMVNRVKAGEASKADFAAFLAGHIPQSHVPAS